MNKSTLMGMMLTVGAAMGLTATAAVPVAKIAKPAGTYAPASRADDDDDDDEFGYPTYENDTFKPLGEGTFRDGAVNEMFGIAPQVYYVEMEESVEHPGVYRLVEPYKDFSYSEYGVMPNTDIHLYIDATDPDAVILHHFYTSVHAKVETKENGEVIGVTDVEILITSLISEYMCRYGTVNGVTVAKDEGVCGKFRHGTITFPAGSLLGRTEVIPESFEGEGFRNGYDVNAMWSYVNSRGDFLIVLPDAPNLEGSVGVGLLEENADGKLTIPVSATFSRDIDEARIMLVSEDYDEYKAEDYYAALIAGTCDYQTMTYDDVRQQKVLNFDFDGTNAYTAYMVTFANGEDMASFHHTRELRGASSDWTTFEAYAEYTETFLSDNWCFYDPKVSDQWNWDNWMEPRTRLVEFEQNADIPGLVRLVNPYTGRYPTYYEYSDEESYDYDRFYYMYFDFSNPDKAFLRTTEKGIGWEYMYGRIFVTSKAYRNQTTGGLIWNEIEERYDWGIWTEEMVTEAGVWGHYDQNTRTLTFPTQALMVQYEANPTKAWYEANMGDSFKLVFPEEFIYVAGVENVAVDSADNANAPIEYYNLQGMRVTNPETGRIYIKRQGNKASKVLYR